MTVTLSFDVEEFDFPLERGLELDFDTQLGVSTEGLELVLHLLESMEVKATFYTTANFAQHRPEIIRRIAAGGHEIASHDFFHAQDGEPKPVQSKQLLEELLGVSVVGYRAPRLAVVSSKTLAAAGYKYNSSINPTWIPTRYNNLFVPRTISYEDSLCIYPVSVAYPLRIPLFWIALHVMPVWLYKLLAYSALRRDAHLNLYFHPWEFSNRLGDPRFGVPGYLTHCSGKLLLAKLSAVIQGLKTKGCRFCTTREYLGFNE